MPTNSSLRVDILDDDFEFSLADLCRCSCVQAETIIEMVEEGMLTPTGVAPAEWRFTGTALERVVITLNLQHDLHVNLAGAALALDLLEEIKMLRSQLSQFDR
jgi:chaperone modulatory protein CbpM